MFTRGYIVQRMILFSDILNHATPQFLTLNAPLLLMDKSLLGMTKSYEILISIAILVRGKIHHFFHV